MPLPPLMRLSLGVRGRKSESDALSRDVQFVGERKDCSIKRAPRGYHMAVRQWEGTSSSAFLFPEQSEAVVSRMIHAGSQPSPDNSRMST
jgi:hypothetical protein